jgi:BirA family biotin operon repressor/biotin-[acetyl-CoA-carboxylase] ligase
MQVIQHHFDTIDSTNSWSKHNTSDFDKNKLTIVTANTQTAGRGRFNRRWKSPAGQNIYATYNFFIEKSRSDIGNIPQLLALSAVQILRQFGLQAGLKWPNDVVINDKKLGGILCETVDCLDSLCVIVGIGINVNMPLELLQEIDRPATSMLVETGKPHEVTEVLQSLTTAFANHLQTFLRSGFAPFIDDFRKAITHQPGQKVRFSDFVNEAWNGTFHAINDDGSLNLLLANGEKRRFITGEFLHQ